MENTVAWGSYEFTVYDPQETNWHEVAGLYIFAGFVRDHEDVLRWHAYYIGQTEDFSNHIPNHEEWSAAQLLGASHVHARTVERPEERNRMERRLIRKFRPFLNTLRRI